MDNNAVDTAQSDNNPPISSSDSTVMDTCIIDELGDLWIVTRGVGSWGSKQPVKFQVCSRALARASPVFKTMLYGGFAEARPSDGGEWLVELPDDPAPAMKQLFEIMHSQFHSLVGENTDVPEAGDEGSSESGDEESGGSDGGSDEDGNNSSDDDSEDSDEEMSENDTNDKENCTQRQEIAPSTVSQLYDLTIAADKYGSISLVRPWANVWLTTITKENHYCEAELWQRAWVYYQLGYEKGYTEAGKQLLMECPLGAQGDDESQELQIVPAVLLPTLHDSVVFKRFEISSSLITPLNQAITRIMNNSAAPLGICRSSCPAVSDQERLDCEALILGHLLRKLCCSKFWPIPAPAEVILTARELIRLLNDLKLVRTQYPRIYRPKHHYCIFIPRYFESNFTLYGSVDSIVERLSEMHTIEDIHAIAYMKEQRRLTGVVNK
ncbi:BTB/POZ domain-containing protein 3/6 [Microdochium nivale]|nr:BTB/POZ domain-containing protein 3/6 [Microdochium nivale]